MLVEPYDVKLLLTTPLELACSKNWFAWLSIPPAKDFSFKNGKCCWWTSELYRVKTVENMVGTFPIYWLSVQNVDSVDELLSFYRVICRRLVAEPYDAKILSMERRILLTPITAYSADTFDHVNVTLCSNVTNVKYNRSNHMMLSYYGFTLPYTVRSGTGSLPRLFYGITPPFWLFYRSI